MPRFFIHIEDEDGHQIDDTGYEATDLEAITRMARDTAAEIICHEVMTRKLRVEMTFYIEDAARRQVAILPVRASIS